MFIVFAIVAVAVLAVFAWFRWRRASSREANKRSQPTRSPRPEVTPQRQAANHGIRSRPAVSRGNTTPITTRQVVNQTSAQAGVTNPYQPPLPSPPTRNTVRVVIVEVRPNGPQQEGGRPVTIVRREMYQGTRSTETVHKAEARLCTEMQETVSAAAAEKVADLIMPAREPEAVAWLAALKSDLHGIMVGQPIQHLIPWASAQAVDDIAQSAPLPGDSTVGTAEFVILAGGLLLSAMAPFPGLCCASVKSLTHKVIADAADKAIKSAIDSALSAYRAPPPESSRQVGRATGPANAPGTGEPRPGNSTPPAGSYQLACGQSEGRPSTGPRSARRGPSSAPKHPNDPDDPPSAPNTPGRP